jgi:hypothetical protein
MRTAMYSCIGGRISQQIVAQLIESGESLIVNVALSLQLFYELA